MKNKVSYDSTVMTKKIISRADIESLNKREEKILRLLREEREKTKQKFPLFYALIATFGLVATISGFSKWIDHIDFLRNNPFVLIIIGVFIMIATGTAYRKIS